MDQELTGEYFEINVADGQTVYFEVRPNETMRDFRDRLQETAGITIDICEVTIEGKSFDEDTNALSYFSAPLKSGVGEASDSGGPSGEIKETEKEDDNSGNGDSDLVGMFCSVPGCPSNKLDSPDLPLFRFPAQKKRCLEWVAAVQRDDLAKESVGFLNTQLAVCANHFPIDQFANKDRKLLKQTAVPTIFLNNVKEENPEPEANFDEDLKLMDLETGIQEPFEATNFKADEAEEETEEIENDVTHPGSLCRLCASPMDSCPLFLFDEKDKCLADLINSSLPITVTKLDVLPKQICQVCAQRLELQHSFAEACLKAEKKLIALTRRFMVNGLKKTGCGSRLEACRKNRNKQTHCCPLCCLGGMRYLSEQMQEASSDVVVGDEAVADGGDDSIQGLYSDEGESDGEAPRDPLAGDNPNAALDLVYLPEDRQHFSYECEVCEETFSSASECLEHCSTHAAPEYFPCTVCGLVFPAEDLLGQHFGQHKLKVANTRRTPLKTVLSCTTCGIQVLTKKDFILHKCSKPSMAIRNVEVGADLACQFCDRTFMTASRAETHRAVHSEDAMPELFSCQECASQPMTEKMLENHMAVVHEGVEHRCEECGLRFITEHHLTRHAKMHQSAMYQYQCSLCNRMFPTLPAINKHVDMHNSGEETDNEKEKHVCPKCEQTFTQRSHLQHHLETAHDSMGRMPSLIQYQCNVCSERIKTSAEVLVHRTLHWKSRDPLLPYVCEYCGEPHPSPNALARHRRYLHPDEHPYVCTLCDTATRTLYEARVHRKTHTGYVSTSQRAQPKIYQCEQCPSLFSDKTSFLAHKKSHKVAKWYQCDMCDKAFPERHRLIVHKRLHTGEKPYACGTCGKRFAQTSAMYTHALLHTGETPHSCDLCNRRFRIKSDRDSHRRTHTGEKPYKCPFCAKTFRTGQVYYQHRMIHTGERRFPCDVCGRAFKRSHTLVCHKRIHTGEKPNVCDVCGKGFRQRTDMRKHKMNLHNIAA